MGANSKIEWTDSPKHLEVWVHPDGTWSSLRRDGSEHYVHAYWGYWLIEITRLRNLVAEKDAEIERLKAENEELRREIGGFPHLSDMRQCMIDTAGDNERLKKALDQAIHIGGIGFVRRTRKLNDWYDDTNHIESDPITTSSRSTEYPELARYLEEMGKKE